MTLSAYPESIFHPQMEASHMKKAGLILSLVLAVLVIIFVFQNWSPVGINLLFWRIEIPRLVLVGFFVLSGFILGVYTTLAIQRRPSTDVS